MFIQCLKVIIFAKATVCSETNKAKPSKPDQARMQLEEISKKAQAKIMG